MPQEIQSKGGPVSISRDIAGAFGLEGVREVCVRRVEREEVGLDLVELRIKARKSCEATAFHRNLKIEML